MGSPPRARGEGGGKSKTPIGQRITPACAGRSVLAGLRPRSLPDHPRVCGEKVYQYAPIGIPAGSPPRVRGEGKNSAQTEKFDRITPACAGRSHNILRQRLPHQDHPRVCGEKSFSSARRLPATGSPPRVRGEGLCVLCRERLRGITPACAGRRVNSVLLPRTVEDHPRVCGEKVLSYQTEKTDTGSPPRVRGEVVCSLVALQAGRITPACAGRSAPAILIPPWGRDHPRVCGEKMSSNLSAETSGSPPRVRGEGHVVRFSSRHLRITPACAGRSYLYARQGGRHRDHPRVCGEKSSLSLAMGTVWGSPPRVRGEAHVTQITLEQARITPACAGRSRSCIGRTPGARDHPRVCGEKLCRLNTSYGLRGITPACAGRSRFHRHLVEVGLDHPRVCGEK